VPVDVTVVAGRRDLKAFIDLPYRLHATSPVWVPPLKLDQRMLLSRRLSAFFKHGAAEYFLARRDGRVVGRISAHIDRAFNDFQKNAWGWFGFIEFEDDAEVLDALLAAAESWLRAHGRDRMVGPANFAMNDESGILIEGHALHPMLRQPWQPPYYQRLCEAAGLAKAVDLFMWQLHISGRENVAQVIWDLAADVEAKHGIVLRKMSRRSLRKDMDVFAEIYNAAWAKNWGFVPFSKTDLDAYAQEMQLVFDRNWMMVAERKDTGEAVGMAMTFPDANQLLKKIGNGRLFPFGWWTYLRGFKKIDRVRVGFLGVKPEYQHTGVAAKLYEEHFDMAAVTARTGGEMGWILETNRAMNRGMEAMGGTIVKKYRVYERVFES
jgi:GNAT superfamily N-acetyltransferase